MNGRKSSSRNPQSLITSLILAGGKSSRMGKDKALIEINGVPLLQRTCVIAQELSSQVYVVTPWGEKYENILPHGCQIIPEVALPGASLPHGALVGFAQALAQVQTEWVLLLACDLPRLNAAQLQQWREHILEVSEDIIALLPKHEKGWEPLCGFYRRRCLSLLDHFIAQGGRSFQAWLAQHPVQELPLNDSPMLFNCNTPEDLQKLDLLE